MATESVSIDRVHEARDLIREAVAIQEMAIRVRDDNMEDFTMLQRACNVTFRLLEAAENKLALEDSQP